LAGVPSVPLSADRAGVVDQHIDAAELLYGLQYRRLDRLLIAHIQLDRQSLPARLLHFIGNRVYRAGQFGMRLDRLAGDHHFRAIACATQRDLPPDTATGTGDEN